MKIKQIISQSRRDFKAEFECEHCGDVVTKSGYDDKHFHTKVIPDMECGKCKKKAKKEDYRPLATKHKENETV